MKAACIILFLLGLSLIAGCGSQETPDQATPSKTQLADRTDCDILKSNVTELIKGLETCTDDTDCIIDTKVGLVCPFGCVFIRSSQYDEEKVSEVQKLVDRYYEECPVCEYQCAPDPQPEDIRCVENRCVDTRFI
ncbi:TPA: hypothetical protein HA265_00455 [Candidatus Woesearchaeota archaeon]|nr:hypothetical protein [Candidatus Woesearchaeota archaeon]